VICRSRANTTYLAHMLWKRRH